MTIADIKTPVVDVKSISPKEKVRIRGLLDKYFDDAAGAYIDGYSDNRIAEEINIPRSHVVALREAAYGPLKRDPEVDALLTEFEACRKRLSDMQSELGKLELRVAMVAKKQGL